MSIDKPLIGVNSDPERSGDPYATLYTNWPHLLTDLKDYSVLGGHIMIVPTNQKC